VAEISRTLATLLDKAEAFQLLTNLTALGDMQLAGTVLTTARLQGDRSVLTSCTELSSLLVYFQRDRIPPPEVLLPMLQQRPEDLTKLVQACIPMLQNPANQMITLASMLLTELSNRRNAELLVLITEKVRDLLTTVTPDRVQEFGQELIAVSRDAVGEEKVRRLLANFEQIRARLEQQLRAGGRVTLQSLEPPLPQPQQDCELVHVTSKYIRFFDVQTKTLGDKINLSKSIQANSNSSSWVILNDRSVFCCGGEYYAG
jgi:hypothetical protein